MYEHVQEFLHVKEVWIIAKERDIWEQACYSDSEWQLKISKTELLNHPQISSMEFCFVTSLLAK